MKLDWICEPADLSIGNRTIEMRSETIFNKVAGKRWFSITLLGLVAVLLILVSLYLGRKVPPLPPLKPSARPRALAAPVEKIEQLSSKTAFLRVKPFAGTNEPFYTLNFKAPPAPVQPTVPVVPEPPKPPPPPPTKKVAVLYQGVYETAKGNKKAFLQVDGKLAILPLGGNVAADWDIGQIANKNLTLTNRAGQTNILNFNRATEIVVPAN